MEIINSTIGDIDEIFRLYKIASAYMQTKYIVHWPDFERSLVETEILENRQWKLLIDNQIACVWATTFDDPQIWEEKNKDAAVYIHRIGTNPDFRGQNFVGKIVEWAKGYARQQLKEYIRLDTVGENEKLIKHYTKNGFSFLGCVSLKDLTGLPAHYKEAPVSLFEIKV